jgi:uncharacterized protein
LPGAFHHLLNFVDELFGVVELPVHGGEPDIGDFVEFAELAHDQFADLLPGHFTAVFVFEFGHDALGDGVDFLGADGAFFAGAFDAAPEFATVEFLVVAAAFLDAHGLVENLFVRREAGPAIEAFTTTTDGGSVRTAAGVDHLVILCAAFRASHSRLLPCESKPVKRAMPQTFLYDEPVKRILMNILLLAVFAYVFLAVLLRWREPRMIYYPIRQIEGTPQHFDDVFLPTPDGEKINGWFIPSLHANAPVILFFHGNAGNISHRLEKLACFQELGADVFIIDYRGYGRSTGAPSEQGTYRDARAAYEYLTQERNISPSRIVLYGESLGSAVAVELATKTPVGGLIIEEPFTSTADVGRRLFPFLPVGWLVQNKYDSIHKIGHIKASLLIFHSRNDEMFPYSFAERLLAAAPEPKRLVALSGSHNDAFATSTTIYRQGLKTFLGNLTQ